MKQYNIEKCKYTSQIGRKNLDGLHINMLQFKVILQAGNDRKHTMSGPLKKMLLNLF